MNFREFLNRESVVILDGAMGTELQKRGYKTKLPFWSSGANWDAIDLVTEIHRDYCKAGADVLSTNTFRTQKYIFDKYHRLGADKYTLNAVSAALKVKSECSRPIFVAGSMVPLEDCYEPDLVARQDILLKDHFYQAKLLKECGVDFILGETLNCFREAEAIAQAAQNADMDFLLSFVVKADGALLSGEKLVDVIERLEEYQPLAMMLNCRPIPVLTCGLNILIDNFRGFKGVYPNGDGTADDDLGWKFFQEDHVDIFLDFMNEGFLKGLKILGGCCGTSPDYIRALSEKFKPHKQKSD